MDQDQVRDEQRSYGRAQEGGSPSSTLHVRPNYSRSGVDRRSTGKPGKPMPKGHEAFLKALEASGATVQFEKASSGEKIVGTIKTSDKFTVSVSHGDATRVLFKHDISEFTPLTANPKKQQELPSDDEDAE